MADDDGADDFVESQVRLGLLLATKAAHSVAERRREQLRAAEQNSQANARQLHQVHEAERAAAGLVLREVGTPPWWEQAGPEHIAREWERATSWAPDDPRALQAQDRLVDGLRKRYGITVDRESLDYRDLPAMVRALEPAAEQERDRARDHRDASEAIRSKDPTREPQAAEHARAGDRHEHQAGQLDTLADRARAELPDDLSAEQTVGFTVRAEAYPAEPIEAIRDTARPHPRARKNTRTVRGRGAQRQTERGR